MPRKYQDDPGEFDEIDELFGFTIHDEPPADPFAGLTPCQRCKGTGYHSLRAYGNGAANFCGLCGSSGYRDMPTGPTDAPPGSPYKLAVIAARYMHGMPLFHPEDRNGLR